MIVPDVNVVAYLYIDGELSGIAREVLARDADWILPRFWRYEFLNILAGLGRRSKIDPAALEKLRYDAFSSLCPRDREVAPSLVLATARNYGVTAYDAHYLALALQSGCLCVTEDRALRRCARGAALSMKEFTALPLSATR